MGQQSINARFAALRAIPLPDVMEKNGFKPVNGQAQNATHLYYNCPVPHHKDTNASFSVSVSPVLDSTTGDNTMGMFQCLGCGTSGKGAISLQALLMGVPNPKGSDFWMVVKRLCRDHHITLPEAEKEERYCRNVDPVDHLVVTPVEEITGEHLAALGCAVVPIMNNGEVKGTAYSFEPQFYSPYANERISRHTPAQILDAFDVTVIKEVVRPQREGESFSRLDASNYHFPMFAFRLRDWFGNTQVKIYSPYSNTAGKWSAYAEHKVHEYDSFAHCLFGDKDVLPFLLKEQSAQLPVSRKGATVDIKSKDAEGEILTQRKFKRICICSGPRDAMQVYYHSDCHVVWPYSEKAAIDMRIVNRLKQIAEQVFILYDTDATGVEYSRQHNMKCLWLRNVELPYDLSQINSSRSGKPCKDVSEYFENYGNLLHRSTDNRFTSINEHFNMLLNQSESLEFYDIQYTGKVGDKKEGLYNKKYSIVAPTLLKFLYYNGFCRYQDENGNVRLCIVNNKIVEFVKEADAVARAKRMMDEWLYNHNIGDTQLHHVVDQNKTLNRETFNRLPIVPMDFTCAGEDYQYKFFANYAVKVTADEIIPYKYSDLDIYVNVDKILPHSWVPTEPLLTIGENPNFEALYRTHSRKLIEAGGDDQALKTEAERWREEERTWKYQLVRHYQDEDDLPAYIRFMMHTCQFFHEDETKGIKLTDQQRQYCDMHMILRMWMNGYMMAEHRDGAHPWIPVLMDVDPRREHRSNGRSGKSLTPYGLETVQYVKHVPGKDMNTGDQFARNFWDLDYMKTSTVDFSDIPANFDIERMFNAAEGDIRIKVLHQNEITVPRSKCPKFILSYNKVFDTTPDSVKGRIIQVFFSDYYHVSGKGRDERSPFTEFDRDILRFTDEERQQIIAIYLHSLQFYLGHSKKLEAPVDNLIKGRIEEARYRDKQFGDWARNVFCTDDRFIGVPLPKRDLQISWYQWRGWDVQYLSRLKGQRLLDFEHDLDVFVEYNDFVKNPEVCRTLSDRGRKDLRPNTFIYEYDKVTGKLLPERVKKAKTPSYYIYSKGNVPRTYAEVKQVTEDPAPEGYTI